MVMRCKGHLLNIRRLSSPDSPRHSDRHFLTLELASAKSSLQDSGNEMIGYYTRVTLLDSGKETLVRTVR